MSKFALLIGTAALLVTSTPALSQNPPRQAKASKGQQLQQAAMNDVPRCPRKHGTVSIVDGQDSSGWTQNSLAPLPACCACSSSGLAASTSSIAVQA